MEIPVGRGVYCNRTLNLRSIRAIGYDMDYTLVHYHVDVWEERAYEYARLALLEAGWPVEALRFDPAGFIRGLAIDRDLGNLVKANRFGYVKRAQHGMKALDFDSQRRAYAREIVDLSESRFRFLNTLFSLSEACIYSQLVDLMDEGALSEVMSYAALHDRVRGALDAAHTEGRLKAEIVADPDRFVAFDPETPLALLDQRRAGKRLLLITNSEWSYTRQIMGLAFDRFLPEGTTWRDLFDVVIVSARKPLFFTSPERMYQVADLDGEGLLRPAQELVPNGVFHGGNADIVEQYLGLRPEQILYVGDHLYGDVHVSKQVRRWRTALVLRELEGDLGALSGFEDSMVRLRELMGQKAALELALSSQRLWSQRARYGYGPPSPGSRKEHDARARQLRAELVVLDDEIAPLAIASGTLNNERWGLLMRTGNDKSLLTRSVERHADIYMSRVSNFLYQTPFTFLRPPRGSLPHDLD
jgi:HAD superfamily 5'-nucleotidase-like hydrolase